MLMTWFAVVLQYYLTLQNRVATIPETTVRFFSFFTIWSNTLIAIYFTSLLTKNTGIKRFFLRAGNLTAITVYITVGFLIYQFVLRQLWSPQGIHKVVDELLHTVVPIYFITFWFLYEEKEKLKWAQMPVWLTFPLIYLLYIMIRGNFSGFYPYPFVDLPKIGLQKFIVNSIWMTIAFIFFAALYILLAKVIVKTKYKNG